ncbi:hypothetical protein EDB80DRAFT_3441 [Ilyonectria destructans]|nr:hypothetical protein EDB80DRAFT_3441 [Ilyonectria destructans]
MHSLGLNASAPRRLFAAASHYARPRQRRSRRTINGNRRPARVEVHLNHTVEILHASGNGVCREASGPEIQVAKDARTPGCKPAASRHRKPTGRTQGTLGRLCSRHRISGLASPITVAPAHSRSGRDAGRKTRRSRWARGVGFRPGTAVRRQVARPIGTSTTNARSGVTATGCSLSVIWASGNWLNASRVRQGARSARCEVRAT